MTKCSQLLQIIMISPPIAFIQNLAMCVCVRACDLAFVYARIWILWHWNYTQIQGWAMKWENFKTLKKSTH